MPNIIDPVSPVLSEFTIFCETEGQFVNGFGLDVPTQCYNNHSHTVNPDSAYALQDATPVQNILLSPMSCYSSDTDSSTATQSGTTVTGSGTSFTSDMVGGIIIFDDGSRAFITGFTSATSLTVAQSQSVSTAGQFFAIYYGGTQADESGNASINNIRVTATSNHLQLGSGTVTTIHSTAPASNQKLTIPDSGKSTANILLSEGPQTINGANTFTSTVQGQINQGAYYVGTQSSGTSLINNTTTTVAFDSDTKTSSNITKSSNTDFKVLVSGLYQVHTTLQASTTPTLGTYSSYIEINGAGTKYSLDRTSTELMVANATIYCSANDVIRVKIINSGNGTNSTVTSGTFLSITLLNQF